MLAVGAQERGLVDTEVTDLTDAVGVIDQRGAVLNHRVHHGPPAHPHLLGHARYRPGVLTDLTARLGPGPTGEHHLRVDVVGVLGPRLRRAVPVGATPPALAPHEAHRPPETDQVTDRDRRPLMRDRPGPTLSLIHISEPT